MSKKRKTERTGTKGMSASSRGADKSRPKNGNGKNPAKAKQGGKRAATNVTDATATKKEKRVSGLDAAAQVLAEAGEPMTCKALVERILTKGLWKTGGKTPHATLYSAMHREIVTKGSASRFVRTGRGLFTAGAKA